MPPADSLARLGAAIARASRITILTGAGVSAASGIPTFRGPGGLWRTHRPEELATPLAFARDPHLVWEWYDWRRQLIAKAEPNASHHAIATLTTRPGTTLVTQNVDGLHERAGSTGLLRLHGSIWRLRCWAECNGTDDWEDLTTPLAPLPPRCPHCGGLARPAVVWFGEMLVRTSSPPPATPAPATSSSPSAPPPSSTPRQASSTKPAAAAPSRPKSILTTHPHRELSTSLSRHRRSRRCRGCFAEGYEATRPFRGHEATRRL